MATYGYTFTSGDTVTPTKLNNARTVSAIQTADISDAQITTDKLADSSVTSAKIADGTIVNADINASAAIVDTKLATISTAGKVANSATTATSANTASAIVARDASGNFTAGTITATGINLGETTLSVYEQGTFTPAISLGFTSATYAHQLGHYTRVGNRCFFQMRIDLSGGTATDDQVRIEGLPFTSASGIWATCNYYLNAGAAGGQNMRPLIHPSTSEVRLHTQNATNVTNLVGTTVGNTLDILITGNYQVA